LLNREWRRPMALLFAACAAGCGDDAPAPPPAGSGCAAAGEAALPIVRGALDAEDPAVVAVNTLDVDCQRAGAPACTGTLIAPDVALTAAHCVAEVPPERLGVLLGATADPGQGELGAGLEGSFFRVAARRLHPAFDPATLANDVALLRLDGEAQAPPVALPEAPIAGPLEGAAARVVGFGQADEAPAFAKREGTVAVTAASAAELTYEGAPSMTCAGDSGGPVLMTLDGTERLVAVTSHGDAACADFGVAIRADALPHSFLWGGW
jgi:secreted trypsin-like serine protease